MALWEDAGDSGGAWGHAHAGAMMQNACLHAAAQDWSAVARGFFDGEKRRTLLKLAPKRRIVLTQSVGPRE